MKHVYKIDLIHRAFDWDASFTIPADTVKAAKGYALAKLKGPDAWLVISCKPLPEFDDTSAHLKALLEHLQRAKKAFDQDPTPRVATAMKQLVGAIKYERKQLRAERAIFRSPPKESIRG